MQDKTFRHQYKADSGFLLQLNQVPDFRQLSKVEKEAVYWIGVLRKNPSAFGEQIIKPFIQQFPELRGSDSRSLEKELAVAESMSILLPSGRLKSTAFAQATFLSSNDQLTHNGPKGISFKHRMQEAGIKDCAGENLFEGKSDPLVSLILLLIDHGVKGYGHRKTLLNPAFTRIGLAIVEERQDIMVMVQDFSCN
jgi:hypothetical protein